MTTLTLPAHRLDEVQPGDRIIAIDGKPTARTLEVDTRLAYLRYGSDVQGIRLVNPFGTETEWFLYPDTQVERALTVERGPIGAERPPAVEVERPVEAPAPKPRQPRKMTRHGLTLISTGAGRWVTEDGTCMLDYDTEYLTDCEEPHPVRLTPAMIASIKDRPGLWPGEAKLAVSQGRRGYLCPGWEHTYATWAAWWGDVPIDRGDDFESMWQSLADAIARSGLPAGGQRWDR